jgi:hypothetical protein
VGTASRDPRSKKKDGWLDETEQATLFRWLSCNEKHLVVSNSARRGAPRAFQLDFGAYEGHRLEQLVQHSIQSGGRTHLLPAAKRTASTPRPGAYVLWLASGAFDWSFPRHLHLYLMLKSMEANGAYVWPDAALASPVAIKVSERAEQEYEKHVAVTLAPLAGERNPYGGGGSRGASGGGAAQPTTEAADDGDEGADADPGWSPMDDIDRVENALPNAQNEYFQSILDEVAGGSRPLFGNWQRMDTYPADPTCGSCDDADGFALMPIDWWSPPTFWASKGVTAPCIVGGWAHSHAVSLGEWRQRRAKGLFSDRGLAGQRTECSLCKQQHAHLKQHLAALKTQDPHSAMITTLEAAAPCAVRPPPAGLAPVVEEEEERGAQGARGPLPLAADVVRLPGAGAADVVATEGPLPAEVAADPQVVLLPVPKKGEQDDEGRTRAQVLVLNRLRRWTAKQTPEARAARNGKRKERGDQRQDARARRRSGDSEDEGEEEGEEEDE